MEEDFVGFCVAHENVGADFVKHAQGFFFRLTSGGAVLALIDDIFVFALVARLLKRLVGVL